MTSTAVKWIRHDMRGAPEIKGNAPGASIAALKALLVTGWGSVTALSVSVEAGIATATFNAGSSFTEHAVVLVAGATPAALNGEARVLTASNTQITFATTAPDGLATGTITVKNAPAGWEEVFSGTNKSVFRHTDVLGSRFYLRVDDSNGLYARVCGYESMTDIDTGTGLFPTAAMLTGGGYWHKSTTANSTAIPYAFVADGRLVLHALTTGAASNAANTACAVRGFGDFVPASPSGDAFACVLSCAATAVATSNIDYGALSGSASDSSVGTGGFCAAPRGWQGLGGAVLQRPFPLTGLTTALSGAADYLGAAPSFIDGQVKTSIMALKDQGAQNPMRGIIPGVHYIPQTGAVGLFSHLSVHDGSGDLEGRKLLAVHVGSGTNTPATGVAMLDLSGPWR